MKKLAEQENLQETFERLDEMGQDRAIERNIARMKFQGDSSDKINYQNLIPISVSSDPEISLKTLPLFQTSL